jgi:hypothetical protein
MNHISKSVIKLGLLSLLSVLPLAAQMDNGVEFSTSFPFSAGNGTLPAGDYRMFQPDMNIELLQIQSLDGRHSAFVTFIPTQSDEPQRHSAVTFEKYGDTDYLDRVSLGGEEYGVKVEPSKTETRAIVAADAAPHSAAAGGQ